MKSKTFMKKTMMLLLSLVILMGMSLSTTQYIWAGDQLDSTKLYLKVNNDSPKFVKAYNASYRYNTYVSIRDVANALNNTEKNFAFTQETEKIGDKSIEKMTIDTGKNYTPKGGENEEIDLPQGNASLTNKNKIVLNGKETKFYTYLVGDNKEPYIKIVDLCYILDANIDYNGADELKINTKENFTPDVDRLTKEGYFSSLHGVVVGDAETGEVLYSNPEKDNNPEALASTTKLMTYILVKEAMAAQNFTMDDKVVVSEAVETESHSEDAVISMKKGQEVTVSDLLEGMLIPSSNECALCLAEKVAGNEEKFVKMMNDKAKALGLNSTTFYNPHGLPNYSQSGVTSKRQNTMSAMDLFKLSSYVLVTYPEITDITSKKEINLVTLNNYKDTNTNPLLYNMEGVMGLKTGTTNRAGCNLVAYLPYTDSKGKLHKLVAVEMGAESSAERGEKTEMLLLVAKDKIEKGILAEHNGTIDREDSQINGSNSTVENNSRVETSNATDNHANKVRNDKNKGSKKNPLTGDATMLYGMSLIALCALVSFSIVCYRKRQMK